MRFMLPPHPSPRCAIPRKDLPLYDNGKFLAQRKFNGTHVVIWIGDDVEIRERRGNPVVSYDMTPAMKRCLISLRRNRDLIVCGELLHKKAKSKLTLKQAATNTICLFDVLWEGKLLTSIDQVERLELLSEICGHPTQMEGPKFPGATSRALTVKTDAESSLWLAETFMDDFLYRFDECNESRQGQDVYPEIEGLMLRRRDSRLVMREKGIGDVNWMIRCRKSKDKVYPF